LSTVRTRRVKYFWDPLVLHASQSCATEEEEEEEYLHLHYTTILKLFNERLLSLEIRIAHLKDFVTRVHIPLDAQLGLGKQ